jgi:hypothetical protein
MPKIRNIKPEFWTDEKIVELSPWARLLFIGMWNFADDNGVVEDKPKQLKMRIFPSDNVEVAQLLQEIEAQQLVIPYKVDGKSYYWIPNFTKHQYISESKKTSSFPPPPQELLDFPGKSQKIPLGSGSGSGIMVLNPLTRIYLVPLRGTTRPRLKVAKPNLTHLPARTTAARQISKPGGRSTRRAGRRASQRSTRSGGS